MKTACMFVPRVGCARLRARSRHLPKMHATRVTRLPVLLFAAASCVAAGSASLDPTTIEPPPPPADPPPPLPSARRIPLSVVGLGGVGVLAGSLPVCRRAVSGGVERLIRSVRSRSPSASRVAAPSDSDGAQCEGGVCEAAARRRRGGHSHRAPVGRNPSPRRNGRRRAV